MRHLIFAALLFIPAKGLGQSLDPPFDPSLAPAPQPISSWFGPRLLNRPPEYFEFHAGVDYAEPPGEPIAAVESGTVTNIDLDPNGGGYYVEITGATGVWRYLHTFNDKSENSNQLANSGNWVLSIDDGVWTIHRPKICDGFGFCSSPRLISDQSPNNSVATAEMIAPVGNSLNGNPTGKKPGIHLHLGFLATDSSPKSNPLQYVVHQKGATTISFATSPNGQVFGSTTTLVDTSLSVHVDASAGKDLDKVDVSVDGIVQDFPGTSGPNTFRFGGMVGDTRIGMSTAAVGDSGVGPVLNDTFRPYFNLLLDLSSLGDGSHNICVQTTNVNEDYVSPLACASFIIDTGNPSGTNLNPTGAAYSSSTVNALVSTATALSGISSIVVTCSGFSSTTTFSCSSPAKVGPYDFTLAGACTITRTNCAGRSTSETVNVSTGSPIVTLTGVGPTTTQSTSFSVSTGALFNGISTITVTAGQNSSGLPTSYVAAACLQAYVTGPGISSGCNYFCPGQGAPCYIKWQFVNSGSLFGESFSVSNTTTTGVAYDMSSNITLEVSKTDGSGGGSGSISFPSMNTDGDSINGTIQASPIGQQKGVVGFGVASSSPTIAGISVAQCTPASNLAQQLLDQLLASILPGLNPYCWAGSEAVFVSSVPMSFSFQEPAGVVIDTTTLGIYGFDIPSDLWTKNMAANQSVSISSTGFVVASGSFTRTGSYGVYFVGHDSSAPVTTFTIQGSSYVFDQTSFVSTDSFIVLTATDPVVNGFASTVATITYCLDPSSGSFFSVYTTSVPVTPGTHVLQYQSIDYAGNVEPVNTATFTVTAGAALKDSSDDTVSGGLLVGSLGSGAMAEIVARAQDSTTLAISSANRQFMMDVTNIGNVGVGVPSPMGQLDLGSESIAMQLKSGNLTFTGTSVQAAFGFNGDVSMRHVIQTFHSTATAGNEMDFLVWTPDVGSTTTIATKNLLALTAISTASGGSMHVEPSGTPDVELEVSNGLSTGGGTMQRLNWVMPSSRRFKSDIKYLSEKDEDRALEETSALKHVLYRYRSRGLNGLYDDPGQPEHLGLIYEDSPDSIRGPGETLLANERLANVELALKAAMRKLEILEKRYEKLKARKKP